MSATVTERIRLKIIDPADPREPRLRELLPDLRRAEGRAMRRDSCYPIAAARAAVA